MKYIITDSIKSVNRIIRRKNYEGISTFGVDAVTALGLAWQIVIAKRSEEGLVSARLINNNTASAIVLELMLKNPELLPFVPRESVALATAKEILNNMNLLRTNEHEESFNVRVQELLKFIGLYEETLNARGLYDEPVVLREAIKILESDSSKMPSEEVNTCYYNKPSMLETQFVSLLNNTGEFEKPANIESMYSFVKAYGISNEIDYIAKTIIDNNIPLGDTEIVCDTAVYAPFIKECFSKRGLTYNFTSSVSGAGFNFIQILKNLLDWNLNGCKYEDLFNVMLNPVFGYELEGKITRAASAYFKGISYGIGWGTDRYFDVKVPEYDAAHGIAEKEYQRVFREIELPALGKLSEKLNNAETAVEALDALTDYGNSHKFKTVRENRYTVNAILNLRKSIASVQIDFSNKTDMFEYLKNELSSISYSQSESSDAANISSIYMPACIERKYIFIPGLSAKEFKISTAESPVMSDELRKELFGVVPCGNVSLAENAINEAEEVVRDLLQSAPLGASITLISSSADNMRDSSEVATSALFEKLLIESGKDESDIVLADSYNEITTFDSVIPHDAAWNSYDVNWPAKESVYTKSFSKSSLDEFLECPLRYHYSRDLYINKEEYTSYDPGKWLAPNEAGTLVHRILELYANNALKGNTKVSEIFDSGCKEFTEAVEVAVKEIESANAAPSLAIKDAELKNYISMASTYLTYLHKELHDTRWVVFSCEENMNVNENVFKYTINDTEIELKFTGVIDRIDRKQNADGSYSYRIQDYKTGKPYTAKKMMADTKQHLIYASYVKDKYGGEVECFDYLFLKALKDGLDAWIATIDSNDLANDVLTTAEKDTMYQVLADHNYMCLEYDPGERGCNICKYKDICLYTLA